MPTNAERQIPSLQGLGELLEGELHDDSLTRSIYATDASVYQEQPLGVVYPKSTADIQQLVAFAHKHQLSLIPRAGGTSLSGQCVGSGLVVDVSRFLDQVLDFDPVQRWVKVQPGIIRNQLNDFLKTHQLFFAPITSTANRATIGGMVGNNSCGTNSVVYGNTRRYVKAIKAILSDGSEVLFEELTAAQFVEKLQAPDLEGDLYRQIHRSLSAAGAKAEIRAGFPKASIHRRNTGYAIDALLDRQPFNPDGAPFNFCPLMAGSEGTLAFITEITLEVSPLPPPAVVVALCQFQSVKAAMEAVAPIMRFQPTACELMDKIILDCTKENIQYRKTRALIKGDPAGVLMVEFRATQIAEARQKAAQMIGALQSQNIGYSFSTIEGEATKEVWELRSAGLGLLANIPGEGMVVACIEDTAVAIEDLANYMEEFAELMKTFGQEVVYYGHAGAGEIHLRPIFNLKEEKGLADFQQISLASAELVKKYGGSLSGEHGDGRVRAPFIPLAIGEANYQRLVDLKNTWDPHNIFNPHKIVKPKAITADLRYSPQQNYPQLNTLFDFSATGGLLRLAEKCNGSGDCRKLPASGGTMCPSYQATRQEKHSTRARANALRNFLTQNTTSNPFDQEELKEVLDLCISCKGCTSECPSNVDMSTMKAEFQYQYFQSHGLPLRARAFAYIGFFNSWGIRFPRFSNFMLRNKWSSWWIKKILGIAPKRSLPPLAPQSLRHWYAQQFRPSDGPKKKQVYLFCDAFTNYNDTEIGSKAIRLLDRLGYDVKLVQHAESGRAAISKGLLEKAKKEANENVKIFSKLLSEKHPLIGIEPSAILSFRDEYPKLVDAALREKAHQVAKHSFLIEEFLAQEIRAFRIRASDFSGAPAQLLVHGHCHQKALSNMSDVFTVLSLPEQYQVKIMKTGCCGMAGSFGYEKEHYEISQQIGNLQLFPQIRAKKAEEIIVAAGTSCRHQIKDGTQVQALHPVEVLYAALNSPSA